MLGKQTMKRVLGLLFLLIFSSSMLSFSMNAKSPDVLISIQKDNVKLSDVLKEIEKQSGYYFVFSKEDLNPAKRISLSVKNEKLDVVLDKLFSPLNVTYIFSGTSNITLKQQTQTTNTTVPNTESPDVSIKLINGRVINIEEDPIIGAVVFEKGSKTNASITDSDGCFSLLIPTDAFIEIRYLGYIDKSLPTSGKTFLTISLEKKVVNLNEVVIVGYGIQKESDLTNAVASISGKDLVKVQQSSLKGAILGKLSGIKYTQTNGEPGNDGGRFSIRDFGEPLTIVDGVERPFSQIDPNEVESISILKDASASIYGFRGANGVIIVTTKKGTSGEPKINYNYSIGFQSANENLQMMDGYQYAISRNRSAYNKDMSTIRYSEQEIENIRMGVTPSTDWYNEAIRSNAPKQQHNMNISGERGNLNYFFSLGYLNQESILKTSDQKYQRYNLRSKVNAKITDRLSAEVMLGGRIEDKKNPYNAGDEGRKIFERIKSNDPLTSIYANNNPMYYRKVDWGEMNPIAMLDREASGYKDEKDLELNSQIALNLNIWEGLSARAFVAFDYTDKKEKHLQKIHHEYEYNPLNNSYTVFDKVAVGSLFQRTQPRYKSTQQYSLNYSKTVDSKHDLHGLLLWEWKERHTDWLQAKRYYSVSTELDQLDKGDLDEQENNGNQVVEKYAGLVGRLNYAFISKYLFEFSFRYDGSSKNSPNNRWGFFPTVSGGWRLAEEPFIKNVIPQLSNLKLRGSWGKIGDDSYLNVDNFIGGWIYPNGNYIFGNQVLEQGLAEANLANMNISWLQIETFNLGLDASWNRKLNLEFDYFYRTTNGKYNTRKAELPTTSGLPLPQENLDSDNSKGFELSIGTEQEINDLSFIIKGNVAYAISQNLHYTSPTYLNQWLNYRNNINNRIKPDNVRWGYIAEGQFQSYEEIMKAPLHDNNGNTSLKPGDIRIKDLNRDGLIDENDQSIIGRGRYPNLNFGLTLNATWRNFDLDVLFQGASMYTYTPEVTRSNPWTGSTPNNNGFEMWTDNWHKADINDLSSPWISGKYPALRDNMDDVGKNTAVSTFWTVDAYYIRLKSIELGYTLPKKITNNLGFDRIRFFINSWSPFTITNIKGVDPEAMEEDFMSFYYPQLKVFTFGINVTL